MTNRNRTEIVNQILETANSGAIKTKIMRKAFLTHDQMKEYLSILTESGLLSYDVYTRTFKTTEKGLRYIDTYNEMSDIMKAQQDKQW